MMYALLLTGAATSCLSLYAVLRAPVARMLVELNCDKLDVWTRLHGTGDET